MEKGTHGQNEQCFGELDYIGQARSLNGNIQNLRKALEAHISKGINEGKDIDEMRLKYKDQLNGIINDILD